VSVTATSIGYRFRPYNPSALEGVDLYRMPRGWWYLVLTASGDSSGGTINFICTLRTADDLNADLWSLEGIIADQDGNVAMTAFYRFQAFEFSNGTDTQSVTGTIELVSTGNNSAIRPNTSAIVHHAPMQQLKGADVSLVCNFATNSNGRSYAFRPWGYIWDGRASSVGGPVRPVR